MQHLEEGTVHAWLDGELAADEAERVARHVAECTECAALVAEARGVVAGASRIVSSLDAGPAGVVPRAQTASPAKRRGWYRFALTPARMSIAATILVAAGVTLTLRRRHVGGDDVPRSRMIDSPIAAPQVAAPLRIADSTSAAPAPAAAPSPPPPATPAPSARKGAAAAGKPVGMPTHSTADMGAPVAEKTSEEKKQSATQPSAALARLDSARAKDELQRVVVDSVARLEARRVAAAGQVTQPVVNATARDAASASEVASQDCYRLDIDSTDWRRDLPSSFALGPAQSGSGSTTEAAANATSAAAPAGARPAQAQAPALRLSRAALFTPSGNVVHAVLPNGRIDSAAVGDWRTVGPSVVNVHFPAVDQRKPVTVLMATNGSTARLISGIRTDTVQFSRITCRR